MSTAAIELPLFPFHFVLFPGTVQPLYVCEAHDRQMIRDCQLEDKPFGVVLAKPGQDQLSEGAHMIGTIAEINNLNRFEDGCYNLMAVGIRRFRVLSSHRERPYLSGFVELYDDLYEPEERLADLMLKVRGLFGTYLNMALDADEEQEIEASLPSSAEELSHFIAHFLEINDAEKQRYLELTSTRQRLQEEIAVLRREIPFLRQILLKNVPNERIMLN